MITFPAFGLGVGLVSKVKDRNSRRTAASLSAIFQTGVEPKNLGETRCVTMSTAAQKIKSSNKKFEENITKRGQVTPKAKEDQPNVSSLMMGVLLVIVIGSLFMQVFRGQ